MRCSLPLHIYFLAGRVRVLERVVLHRAAFIDTPTDCNPKMLCVSMRICEVERDLAEKFKKTEVAVMATRVRVHHRVVPSGLNWLFRFMDWVDKGMVRNTASYRLLYIA